MLRGWTSNSAYRHLGRVPPSRRRRAGRVGPHFERTCGRMGWKSSEVGRRQPKRYDMSIGHDSSRATHLRGEALAEQSGTDCRGKVCYFRGRWPNMQIRF